MTFPNFSAGQIELFFLVLLRVSTIVVMIPILGERTTPARVKGGLAILITFLVLPFVGHPAAGAEIVANTLFMLGASFLLGGLRHRVQEFNPLGARLQTNMLSLATVTLFVPSMLAGAKDLQATTFLSDLSVGLSILLIVTYALGLLFSLGTHREFFGGKAHGDDEEKPWPLGAAVAAMAGATVLIALVSEVFVESVQQAAEQLGMSPAFVGFVVVALVGSAAEAMTAFSAARKNRLDLSVGIAMQALASVIEEAIRFPGFAFVNVQSPCVTYGQEEQQLKAHKGTMQALASLGHDPADRLKAMALASEYGHKLYTGVFYRNPEPPPTYEAEARARQEETRAQARPKDRILEMFRPH